MSKVPQQPVPKTVESLLEYEGETGEIVPAGIWYEVAFVRYMNATFTEPGVRFHLFDWGSYEDSHRGADAVFCIPPDMYLKVDFSTGQKVSFTLPLKRTWFKGNGPTLEVDPLKDIKTPKGYSITVEDDITFIFDRWFSTAVKYMQTELKP